MSQTNFVQIASLLALAGSAFSVPIASNHQYAGWGDVYASATDVPVTVVYAKPSQPAAEAINASMTISTTTNMPNMNNPPMAAVVYPANNSSMIVTIKTLAPSQPSIAQPSQAMVTGAASVSAQGAITMTLPPAMASLSSASPDQISSASMAAMSSISSQRNQQMGMIQMSASSMSTSVMSQIASATAAASMAVQSEAIDDTMTWNYWCQKFLQDNEEPTKVTKVAESTMLMSVLSGQPTVTATLSPPATAPGPVVTGMKVNMGMMAAAYASQVV